MYYGAMRLIGALCDIDSSRRQIYANRIYSISYLYDDVTNSVLRSLTFPRLKHLVLGSYPLNDDYGIGGNCYVDRHFQPTLEKLWIESGDLPEVLLDRTTFKLPRLREISMSNISEGVDATDFLKFLDNFPSLNSMIFKLGMDHVITDQALEYFVNRQNLVRLNLIDGFFTRASIENAIVLASPPFQSIQYLEMNVDSASVSYLARAISNRPMIDLSLYIMDGEGSILDHVSSIKQLQSLEIFYCVDREISAKEVYLISKSSYLGC